MVGQPVPCDGRHDERLDGMGNVVCIRWPVTIYTTLEEVKSLPNVCLKKEVNYTMTTVKNLEKQGNVS